MRTKNMIIAALALLLAACGNEEFIENEEVGSIGELVPMTFTAGTPQTRTSLGEDGHAINWDADDEITIWSGSYTTKNKFTAAQVDGSSASFIGKAEAADTYTAFYPYNLNSWHSAYKAQDNTITFRLSNAQTATAGGFAKGLNPSWAQTTAEEGNTLQFHNLCALVKFTIAEGADVTGIESFSLQGANGEGLAGDLSYSITDDALTVTSAQKEVKLTGTFEAGKTYYFVVAPGELEELNFCYTKGGNVYCKSTTNTVTLEAGKITNLGDGMSLDSDNFLQPITNTTFVLAANNQVGWTKNSDNTVTLTAANLAAMEEVTSLDLSNRSGLTDLSGIEYFTKLESLNCYHTGVTVTGIDAIKGLTNLTTLNFNDCDKLAKLDVTSLTNLTTLSCNKCAMLTTLNVQGLSQLQTLDCSSSQITSLDVSASTNLTSLKCNANALTTLDVSALTNLETLWCNNNRLAELSLIKNGKLTDLQCGNQKQSSGSGTLYLELLLPKSLLEKWNTEWSKDVYNNYVIVSTPTDTEHDGVGDGSTVEW